MFPSGFGHPNASSYCERTGHVVYDCYATLPDYWQRLLVCSIQLTWGTGSGLVTINQTGFFQTKVYSAETKQPGSVSFFFLFLSLV